MERRTMVAVQLSSIGNQIRGSTVPRHEKSVTKTEICGSYSGSSGAGGHQ